MAAKPNKKAPLVSAEWLAGFMDGEGTISLTTRRSRNGRRRPYWEPVVSLVNTNQGVMASIFAQWGGSISNTLRAPSRPPNHRVCYHIKWYGSAAMYLIESIRPYLLMKQQQADLVHEFMTRVSKMPPTGRRGLSDEEFEWRKETAVKVQLLNAKGVSNGAGKA